ncbi:MAG TPA: BamA/TamA family outer membrane protein, partial [Bacteroidota bacterium]
YRLDGGAIEYLTLGNESYGSPSWSPDGAWLAFTSDEGISQNVWMMNMSRELPGAGTRSIRQVTDFVTAAFDPTWGENHQMIFTAFENYSFQIKKIDDVVAVYDSSTRTATFNYADRGSQWVPKEIHSSDVMGTRPYTRQYSLDIAQSVVSTDPVFGTTGGAALAMSDILGNDEYDFLIFNTAQTRDELLDSFNFAISRYSFGQRVNSAYGIFRFAGNRYDLTDPDLFYYEQAFGGYYVLSYPLSKFRRIEAGVTVTNSDKDNYTSLLPRKAVLMSNSISYVWDNSLWGPSGPLDGNRMKLELAYTTDVLYSNVDYYTVIADYRNYLRLSTRSALASRINLWYNDGKEARRFFMGGSWDLRGWDLWSIRGKKIWIVSEELRFPLIDQLGIRFPFGGLSLGSIRSAVFADFGGAWDDQYNSTLGDFGFGFRWNLGGVLVLRYDIGKRIENNFGTLQKGLFYQFFFGWDF